MVLTSIKVKVLIGLTVKILGRSERPKVLPV